MKTTVLVETLAMKILMDVLYISLVPRPPPRFYLATVEKNLGGGLGMRLLYIT